MTWTKRTKVTDSTGLLKQPGFMVAAFMVAGSTWNKLVKATATWTKRTKVT